MPVLKIYKPIGKTPLEIIKMIKKNYKHYENSKMSYAGRLDPMAHGILIILIDNDCYKQHLYHNLDKTYEFELLLGISTDSYDILGLITNCKSDFFNINFDKTIKIIKGFKGKQKQYYPPFSSQRINGKPLWYYAKNNLLDTIIIPSKLINIYSIEFLHMNTITKNEILDYVKDNISNLSNLNNFRQTEILKTWNTISDINYYKISMKVDVSCGTYIRKLCNDIGEKLELPCMAYSIYRSDIKL